MDAADEARQSIAENFGYQLQACRHLQAIADSQWESPWPGRAPRQRHELLIAAETARATKTFRAVLTLCEVGFGEQAAMLNRGLFEGMAVAHWINAHPEEAIERYAKQSRHTQLLWAGTLRRLGWDKGAPALPVPEAGELEELAKLFGPHGTRLWTGHRNLPDLLRSVEDQWDAQGIADLWTFHDIAHRDNNLVLHSGASALERAAAGRSEESIVFDIGPSNRHIAQGLLGAFWPYLQTLSLLMDAFEFPDRPALTQLADELLPTFRKSAEDGIAETTDEE
jgi:hypothetical protein